MVIANSVKERLQSGQRVFGCFIPFPSPEVVEIVALSGFDFALIDNEHGYVTAHTALPMVLAAERHGIQPFVRVGLSDRQEVLKFLDVGCTGIMSPRINTADEARDAVANTKFFTTGERGLAAGRTFEHGLIKPLKEYVEPLNERVLNMIQFEHVDTLEHLDDILAVPGLDVLFVGPSDLAQSLGYPGQPAHPDVTKIADEVVARAKAAGVKTGTVAYTIDVAKTVIDRGFDMIVGTATGMLGQAATTYISALKN